MPACILQVLRKKGNSKNMKTQQTNLEYFNLFMTGRLFRRRQEKVKCHFKSTSELILIYKEEILGYSTYPGSMGQADINCTLEQSDISVPSHLCHEKSPSKNKKKTEKTKLYI